ncbi:hypothetical protein BKA57DRAFT_460418 [Linnemannia elongata]|nr:hypothetical protein BKA57DRAFT_460418 [Linnemannia elongata]
MIKKFVVNAGPGNSLPSLQGPSCLFCLSVRPAVLCVPSLCYLVHLSFYVAHVLLSYRPSTCAILSSVVFFLLSSCPLLALSLLTTQPLTLPFFFSLLSCSRVLSVIPSLTLTLTLSVFHRLSFSSSHTFSPSLSLTVFLSHPSLTPTLPLSLFTLTATATSSHQRHVDAHSVALL